MKRSKKTNYVDEDDDDDLWDFKFLKRTKKQTKNVEPEDAKWAKTSKSTPKRKVSKVAAERLKSQLDSSSEDSDCLIVSSQNADSDFKENRKRAFLSSTGINDEVIKKSASSNQTQLLVDNEVLSQKVQKSPQPKSSEEKKKQIPQKRKSGTKKKLDKNKDSVQGKNPKTSPKSSNDCKNNQERCPFCQVPFSVLLRLSPNAHTMECMDLPFLPDIKECHDGLSCRSNLPSHYRKYTHGVIAQDTASRGEYDVNTKVRLPDGSNGDDISVNLGLAQEDVCIKVSSTSKSTSLKRSTSKDSSTSTDTLPEISISSPKESTVSSKENKTSISCSDISKAVSESLKFSGSITTETDSKEKSSSKELFKSFDSDEYEVPEDRLSNNETSNKSTRIVDRKFLTERQEPRPKSSKSYDVVDEDVDKDGGFLLVEDEEGDKDLDDLLAGSENGEDTLEREEEEDGDTVETAVELDNLDDDDDENGIDNTGDTGFHDDNDVNDINETLEVESRNDDFDLCDKKEIEPISISNSQEEKVIPSLARKQTSIFSFFTCPKGTTSKTSAKQPTTNCDVNDLKKGLAKIASSPSLKVSKPESTFPLKKASSDVTSNESSNYQPNYTTGRGGKKMCPFYKKIPGTSLTVDAFRYGVIPGCRAYILTHFHYDHYGGLTKHFKQPLYCSKVTGNLVKSKIRVDPQYIHTLPLDEPRVVEGVELTLMEANHCPGAVIILFKLKSGQTFLHTGDFRANTAMESYPPLVGTKIHQLYLDTTYCDPAYSFPSQRDVIDFAVNLSVKHMEACPKSLIVCGSYTIGKERIFIAIAEALDSRVCVKRDKKQIVDCLEDPRIQKRVTLVPGEATVHVLPMGKLNPTGLSEYLCQNPQFSSILALEPTGWSHSNRVVSLDQIRPKYSRNGVTIYGVPYSEHSSYLEMKRFTQFIRPDRILPTVNNANPQSRKKMEDIFRKWMSEIKPNAGNKEAKPINKQVSLKSWFSQ